MSTYILCCDDSVTITLKLQNKFQSQDSQHTCTYGKVLKQYYKIRS